MSNFQFLIYRLSKDYGPVMTVALGSDVWVILSGLEAIKEFGMNEAAVARPDMPTLYELYSFQRPLGKKKIMLRNQEKRHDLIFGQV